MKHKKRFDFLELSYITIFHSQFRSYSLNCIAFCMYQSKFTQYTHLDSNFSKIVQYKNTV